MVGGITVVYATVFNMPIRELLPFIALGIMIWMLISTTLADACKAYVANRAVILEMPLPYSHYVLKAIATNALITAHHMVVVVPIVLILDHSLTWQTLLIVPGLLLLFANLFWAASFLALICARFHDITLVVASIIQLAIFVTPIFWRPEMLEGRRTFILEANPFYHLIAVVRQPILGNAAPDFSYIFLSVTAVLGLSLVAFLHKNYRKRVVFWI